MKIEQIDALGRSLQINVGSNAGMWLIRDALLKLSEQEQHEVLFRWPMLAQFCLTEPWWNKLKDKELKPVEEDVQSEVEIIDTRNVKEVLGDLVN